MFVSVHDHDKTEVLPIPRDLVELGDLLDPPAELCVLRQGAPVLERAPWLKDFLHHYRDAAFLSSAKLARLMTKEFHDNQRKRIAVVLDVSLPSASVPITFFQEMERAISLAASYAVLLIRQNFQVQLVTAESQPESEQL